MVCFTVREETLAEDQKADREYMDAWGIHSSLSSRRNRLAREHNDALANFQRLDAELKKVRAKHAAATERFNAVACPVCSEIAGTERENEYFAAPAPRGHKKCFEAYRVVKNKHAACLSKGVPIRDAAEAEGLKCTELKAQIEVLQPELDAAKTRLDAAVAWMDSVKKVTLWSTQAHDQQYNEQLDMIAKLYPGVTKTSPIPDGVPLDLTNLEWWNDRHYPLTKGDWDACFAEGTPTPERIVEFMEHEFVLGWKNFSFTLEQRRLLADQIRSLDTADASEITLQLDTTVQGWIALTRIF
jgi:hypothetical protein